ncbi:MAG TPA: DUF4331 domain-containing protein [Acidimicrobiales bacterium]|nr:DUF4331 domain-containing protein [Acidimicrobiales bacterium]
MPWRTVSVQWRGDDVLYTSNIDNDSDGDADIVYEFRFQTTVEDPDTFLYNTGPMSSLMDPNWNRRQSYTVTRVDTRNGRRRVNVLGSGLSCPPCNIGPLSTPDYASLAQAAVHTMGPGGRVFAGKRAEGFFVDLGSIFDLGACGASSRTTDVRAVGHGHRPMAAGVNATKGLNVHRIAIQVPMTQLTANGGPAGPVSSPNAVIGVWTSAYRQTVHIHDGGGDHVRTGPFVQVSRLGNPLVHEVLIPGAGVVLDIGPHAGALVVHAPADWDGTEIEIRPAGEAWGGAHAAVRARHVQGRVLHAALFGSLAPGPYDLRRRGAGTRAPVVRAEVPAAAVASARLDAGPA